MCTQNDTSNIVISKNFINWVIYTKNKKGYFAKAIKKALDIKDSTIYNILKVYKNKKGAGGCKTTELNKVFEGRKFNIKNEEVCNNYFKRVYPYINSIHNISIVKFTADHILAAFIFILKGIFIVPIRRNNENTIIKRKEVAKKYFNRILEINDKNFIFIDEIKI